MATSDAVAINTGAAVTAVVLLAICAHLLRRIRDETEEMNERLEAMEKMAQADAMNELETEVES